MGLVAALALACGVGAAEDAKKEVTPSKWGPTGCPPVDTDGKKVPPNATKGDKNVGGNDDADYDMGEVRWVKGDRDVVAHLWCINTKGDGPTDGFFSLAINVSKVGDDGKHTLLPGWPPGTRANCAYDQGKNGGPNRIPQDDLPAAITWVSVNYGTGKPDEVAQKTIYTLNDSTGKVEEGKIVKKKTPPHDFSGKFPVGDKLKDASELTDKQKEHYVKNIVDPEIQKVRDQYGAVVRPPGEEFASGGCDADADGDGIANGADDCPTVATDPGAAPPGSCPAGGEPIETFPSEDASTADTAPPDAPRTVPGFVHAVAVLAGVVALVLRRR
jgi:hypothetical protein